MATRAIKEFGKCLQPSKIRAGNLKPVNSFIDLVGSTPVLGVSSMLGKMKSFQNRTESIPEIMVKLESTNPGWSVKARPALHMIEQAEKRGDINKDTVIIESSSGNTAIAIAMVSAMKGYHFKPVVDVKMPQGKLDLLRIFGADVQVRWTAMGPVVAGRLEVGWRSGRGGGADRPSALPTPRAAACWRPLHLPASQLPSSHPAILPQLSLDLH